MCFSGSEYTKTSLWLGSAGTLHCRANSLTHHAAYAASDGQAREKGNKNVDESKGKGGGNTPPSRNKFRHYLATFEF